MADFPNQVNTVQAPAVAGDFASTNPRGSYVAGPGGLVAGPAGVTVGRFAWVSAPMDGDNSPAVVNNFGTGLPSGFVHREQQALITQYLAASGNLIQPGFNMTLMNFGDFWVTNDGATQALVGQKAYANFADGKITFAATGTPKTGATSTGSTVAASTFSVTGSITGAVLTVSAVSSGSVYPGATISGTNVVTGTQIVNQITPLIAGETANGVGRYNVSIGEQTVASTTVSGTYGTLTIGTATGTFAVGNLLAVSGAVVAGTYIAYALTGAGGSGSTFVVTNNTVVSSQAINVAAVNVETKYICSSTGLAGELVKIQSATNA